MFYHEAIYFKYFHFLFSFFKTTIPQQQHSAIDSYPFLHEAFETNAKPKRKGFESARDSTNSFDHFPLPHEFVDDKKKITAFVPFFFSSSSSSQSYTLDLLDLHVSTSRTIITRKMATMFKEKKRKEEKNGH